MVILKSKYNSLGEWRVADNLAYQTALNNGLLAEIAEMFGWKRSRERKPNGYWTKENVLVEALKHNVRNKWINESYGSYIVAKKNGWLEECTEHMTKITYTVWTLEMCKEEALKYNKPSFWQKNSPTSHKYAKINGWYDECISHMTPKGTWTLKMCVEYAKKYKNFTIWGKNHKTSYHAAKYNGWLKECKKYMKKN
jgi:hypothetical protein